MQRFLAKAVLAVAILSMMVHPSGASAQNRIGGGLGYLFDTDDDFIVLTADARLRPSGWTFTVNPRFDFFLVEGGSVIQVDGNLLYPLDLASAGRFRPYVGAGIAFNRSSYDAVGPGGEDFSESKVGLNLVHGTVIELNNSPLEIFAHAQYTVANEFGNTMVIYAGVLFAVGGGQ